MDKPIEMSALGHGGRLVWAGETCFRREGSTFPPEEAQLTGTFVGPL